MHGGATKYLYQRARELRNNSTHAEEILRGFLKTKPFGIKFRRQHPYSIYILDFYCHELNLAIEIDGPIHRFKEDYDCERTEYLESAGLKVIRFSNLDIENKLNWVLSQIEKF